MSNLNNNNVNYILFYGGFFLFQSVLDLARLCIAELQWQILITDPTADYSLWVIITTDFIVYMSKTIAHRTSQSWKGHFKIACFVQPTVWTKKEILLSNKKKKSIKSSHLRSWKQWIFTIINFSKQKF